MLNRVKMGRRPQRSLRLMTAAVLIGLLTSACAVGSVPGLSGSAVVRVGSEAISHDLWRRTQERDLGADVLQELADEVIILAAGRREGVVPPDEEIDKEIKEIRVWYGQEEAFQKALHAAELTEIDLRRKLTLDLTLEALAMKRVTFDSGQLRNYFDNNAEDFGRPAAVRVRHIALSTQAEADQAMARLTGGEPFPEVAGDVSVDLETRDAGGDFGWFSRRVPFVRGLISLTGEPYPALGFGPTTERARVVLSMPEMRPGQIFGPAPNPYGFSIVQLVEVKPAIIPNFEEVRDRVASKYFRVQNRLLTRALLWELRQSTNYEISHPSFVKLSHRALAPTWSFSPELVNSIHPSNGAFVPGLVETLKVFLHSYLAQDYDGLRLISKSLFWSQIMSTEGLMRPRYDRLVKMATFTFTNSDGISKFTVDLRSTYVEGGVGKHFDAELEVDAFAVAGGTEWKVVRLTDKGGGS